MQKGRQDLTTVAGLAGTLGNAFGLVGFRRPECSIHMTVRETLPSYIIGFVLGLLLLSFSETDQTDISE